MHSETIREENYCLTLSLPEIDWLTEYTARLADAYRAYVRRTAAEGTFCRLGMDWETWEGVGSLRLEVNETCGDSLRVYRRLGLNWLVEKQILLRQKAVLRLAGCRPMRGADGYYFREGRLYAFRNFFRPGMEEGMRRSAWRSFIAEYPADER